MPRKYFFEHNMFFSSKSYSSVLKHKLNESEFDRPLLKDKMIESEFDRPVLQQDLDVSHKKSLEIPHLCPRYKKIAVLGDSTGFRTASGKMSLYLLLNICTFEL